MNFKPKEYWQRIKSDQSNYRSKICILVTLSILITGVFIGAIVYVNGQGSRMAITEMEIQKETDFINQFNKDERLYKTEHGSLAQPVPKGEVERIQNELIQRTQNYQLHVTSVNRLPTPATQTGTKPQDKTAAPLPAVGVEYELSLTGTWEMTVRYIQEIKNSTGLISLRSLAMKPKPNASPLIDTVIKYKIYLE